MEPDVAALVAREEARAWHGANLHNLRQILAELVVGIVVELADVNEHEVGALGLEVLEAHPVQPA